MRNPRQLAAEILIDIHKGQHAQEAVALRLDETAQESRQFCADLVYGTLRANIRIEYILSRFLAKPAKLPAQMLVILKTAVYSLLFQAGMPGYAVVNETVELIKKKHGQKLANVANGALRSILREIEDILKPDWYGNEGIGLYYAMPPAISDLWQRSFGGESAELLMARSFERPWTGLRINLQNPRGPELLETLRQLPNAAAVVSAGVAFPAGQAPLQIMGMSLRELESEGMLSYQAAGSQIVLQELGIMEAWKGVNIWDACAGSGGKSAALIEAGLPVAFASDVSLSRLARLSRDCARLGLTPPAAALADLAHPPLQAWHGNILVDAPCSGLGVLARRPDLKARFGIEKMKKLASIQADILQGACKSLGPGGELAYITCTLNPAENHAQIESLLSCGMELMAEWQTPHEHPWLEGMYGARLRKGGNILTPAWRQSGPSSLRDP